MEVLNRAQIEARIPHRAPFLWLDEAEITEARKSGRGIKEIRPEESVFEGHFPQNPIFPGVLMIEAMGQLAAVVMSPGPSEDGGPPSSVGKVLGRVDRARFLKPVRPGDRLELSVRILKELGGFVKAEGEARVGGELMASAELTFSTGE